MIDVPKLVKCVLPLIPLTALGIVEVAAKAPIAPEAAKVVMRIDDVPKPAPPSTL